MRLALVACAVAVSSAFRPPAAARGCVAWRLPAKQQESGDDDEKKFDMGTLSMRDKVSAYNRPAEDSALLSEAWKAREDPEEQEQPSLGLPFGALGGVGLVLFLAAFSFVPVGDQGVGIPSNDPTKVPVTNFVKIVD